MLHFQKPIHMATKAKKKRNTVPHNGKDLPVTRIEKIGRVTHHYFIDPVDNLEKDYVEIDHPDHSIANAMEEDD